MWKAVVQHFERGGRRVPLYAFALSVFLVWLDFLMGPLIQFPITFLIPVALVSWYSGVRWGLSFGIVLPLVRASFFLIWSAPQTTAQTMINATIRIIVFCAFALLLDAIAREHRVLGREVAALEEILPMCAWCKRVRGDDESWTSIEMYLLHHKSQKVTSGMCPDCRRDFK